MAGSREGSCIEGGIPNDSTHSFHNGSMNAFHSIAKVAVLGAVALPILGSAAMANPLNVQQQQLPRTADELIDRDRLRDIRMLKPCDIQLSWRYSSPGEGVGRGSRNSAGGSGSSARANGTWVSNEDIRVVAVFKNVGELSCQPFRGTVSLQKRVDAAYSGTYGQVRYNRVLPLRPGQSFTSPAVIGKAPCPVGGGEFFAQASRLRDFNQRNNTYKLIFNTERGEVCPHP